MGLWTDLERYHKIQGWYSGIICRLSHLFYVNRWLYWNHVFSLRNTEGGVSGQCAACLFSVLCKPFGIWKVMPVNFSQVVACRLWIRQRRSIVISRPALCYMLCKPRKRRRLLRLFVNIGYGGPCHNFVHRPIGFCYFQSPMLCKPLGLEIFSKGLPSAGACSTILRFCFTAATNGQSAGACG